MAHLTQPLKDREIRKSQELMEVRKRVGLINMAKASRLPIFQGKAVSNTIEPSVLD
ncbi:hypothetical protein [Larkinella punicea]|uniref:hypothetical protein n=1 Tax=Larkinella punicea TaxID=2315727 RepID=UPI0014027763|nr:hypothetical protein [Larkinella punicea]